MAKRYNELSGKEWLQYSFSIWRNVRKANDEWALKHPAMFPVQLASRIIKIYTKKKDVVLDPFLGVGSTALAAYQLKRKAIGFELSKKYALVSEKRLREYKEKHTSDTANIKPKIYQKDARNLLTKLGSNNVDLCVTSPPYWDILNMRRSADLKKISKYSNVETDLGNVTNYESFLNELKGIFNKVYQVLRVKGHCVVVIMDIRKKDKFYPLHSDLAKKMEEIGFIFEDIMIWDRQHEYNNMKPLGYPYVFRVNKVHEYILIFRKKSN